jgi:hypothetical protein
MPTFQVPTDTAHKIKLESHLIYALWMNKRAHAGQEAQVEVKTSLVGNGAKIKITCKNENGKKLDKVEGVVFNNKFEGVVLIPDNVKSDEMIFFEAELPKHSLKGESNLIPVRPAIKVSQLQWDRPEVKRKDVVTLTCQFQSGVEDDDDAAVLIYERNPNSCDIKVVSIPTVIENNKIEMQWEFDYQDETEQIPTDDEMKPYKKKYAQPQFYFIVTVDGVKVGENRESGVLKFVEELTLECANTDVHTAADVSYSVLMADGKEVTGSFGSDPKTTIPGIKPGPLEIQLSDAKEDESSEVVRSELHGGSEPEDSSDSLLDQYKSDNTGRE